MKKKVRAIILAAGRGARMGKLTDQKPKSLLEINGNSLLSYQIKALKSAGIEKISIVTGYKREMLLDYGLDEFHNPLWYQTNMVYSLSCADSWLANYPCIISYSDIFYSSHAIDMLINSKENIAITFDSNWRDNWAERFSNPLDDLETFKVVNNYITEIGNKPQSLDEIDGQYMGLLRFNPDSWGKVKKKIKSFNENKFKNIHMTELLQNLIDSGLNISAISYEGNWGEVDSAFDLKLYNKK